jgi:hypothetical protein
MNKLITAICLAELVAASPVRANTLEIYGQLEANAQLTTTTIDEYHFVMQATGTMNVSVLGYDASQNSTSTAGYYTQDVNLGNPLEKTPGELTWLDPDTQWWYDDPNGLTNSDAIIRCDDLANNCPKYAGTSSLNSSTAVSGLPISVTSEPLSALGGDGSINKRDPWYNATFSQTGNYLLAIGQYYSKYSEVESGIHSGGFTEYPTGYANPIVSYANYELILSSSTLDFSQNGMTITVTAAEPSAVPLPGAVWSFLAGMMGLFAFSNRKESLGK